MLREEPSWRPRSLLVYGIGHGARAPAGEEEDGTLDLRLVTPITGGRIVLQKALALLTCLFVLGATLFVCTVGMSLVFGLGISAGQAGSGSLAMVLLKVICHDEAAATSSPLVSGARSEASIGRTFTERSTDSCSTSRTSR
ncbi:MAG: beta-exotoxin transport system permease protein [Kribbellaceae bacterium]|nr:beta-exotoxin transport system permease protein [Kribbellaceae bacterium]